MKRDNMVNQSVKLGVWAIWVVVSYKIMRNIGRFAIAVEQATRVEQQHINLLSQTAITNDGTGAGAG